MTCTELRAYFEGSSSANCQDSGNSLEVGQHIRTCAECSRLASEQTEIRGLLNLVRDRAPQVPPSLDAVVLANFRYRAERAEVSVSAPLRRTSRLPATLFWRSAIAALILVVAVLPFTRRSSEPSKHSTTRTVDMVASSQPMVAPNVSSSDEQGSSPANTGSSPHHAKRKTGTAAAKAPAAVGATLFPPGFNSLMYCDPLSCAGTMEVIRMQIPTALPSRESARQQTEGVVFADVIVGSDGVARGIRFVE